MSRAEEHGIDLSKETRIIKRMVTQFLAAYVPADDSDDLAQELRDALDAKFQASTYDDLGRCTELLEDVAGVWCVREEAEETEEDEEGEQAEPF